MNSYKNYSVDKIQEKDLTPFYEKMLRDLGSPEAINNLIYRI